MLPKYPLCKPAASQFPRTIPTHWRELRLSQAYGFRNDPNHVNEELLSVYLNKGVVKYSSTSQKQVHKPSEDLSKYQLVLPDDFVLNNQQAWRGSVGVSKWRGIISPAYYVLAPRYAYNSDYMNYMVRDGAVIDQFVIASRGVGSIQRQIYTPHLKRTVLSIPPRDEQDKIVRFLDWKTSEMAHFIKEKRREISLLEELKNSLICVSVIHGTRPSSHQKDCSVDWIHTIPAHWDEVMLFQCAAEQGISNKTVHHQNLLSLSYGKIVNKDINATEGLLPSSFDTYQIVHDGNVILRLTDLQNDHKSLRVGLSTQTGIITSAYTCLKARDNILPEYLYYLLHAYDVSKVFYGMGGGVRQSIGYADIRRMVIPLPPLDEQQEIVDYCREQQLKIEQMIAGIKDEIALVQELRTKTISDVVTGKVDVRDVEIPQYEPEADDSIDDEDESDEDSDEDNSDAVDEEVD
ncbi:MAG: restriction endonuclease subunit S [Eubacteriales bacterium]|nr:restriction endonuclease subunit S [Eubacteriales bacterium]